MNEQPILTLSPMEIRVSRSRLELWADNHEVVTINLFEDRPCVFQVKRAIDQLIQALMAVAMQYWLQCRGQEIPSGLLSIKLLGDSDVVAEVRRDLLANLSIFWPSSGKQST